MTDLIALTPEQKLREQCCSARRAYDEATAPARAARDRHGASAEAQSAFFDAIQGPRAALAEAIEAAEQEYYDATPYLHHPLRRTK